MTVSELFTKDKKPNLLFIITDQERSLQHWPENFAEKNLPALSRLLNTGLNFSKAFTNACLCSPSRATFLTSQYPSLTGVTKTGSPQPPKSLPTNIVNLATVASKAGYNCAWRGKWHLGGGGPHDYGFAGWNPPDAGNYLSMNDTLGGGTPDNDGRYLDEMLTFIDQAADDDQPFCLVASFVNPHDVYVSQHKPGLGYTKDDFSKVTVPLPRNSDENLNTKPRVQLLMSWPFVPHENSKQDYVNFYAYLHTLVDAQIMKLLDRLDHHNMAEDTLIIRFADHGEQALSHNMVEKFFNTYEESIHIPLIFSNPRVFSQPQSTDSLVSLIDLLPTVAHLLGVADQFPDCFYGRNFIPILENPKNSVQDLVHFTYDDIGYREVPSIIRCVRTSKYKYAVYFTKNGDDADWELYDLEEDAHEDDNKAGCRSHASVQLALDRKLQQIMHEMRTKPKHFVWPPAATKYSRGFPPINDKR